MKTSRRSRPLALALLAAAWLPLSTRADDRLAGYWVPAAGEDAPAAFSFSILGKWAIVAPRWDGTTPDFKLRYLVATTGSGGILTVDEKPERIQGAPKTFSYEVKGGELFLAIPDTEHGGKYHLVKGTPPASAPAAPAVAAAPVRRYEPGPPRPPLIRAQDPNAVLGDWTTEPGTSVQVTLHIVISGPTSVKITQLWVKGSDNPVTSRAGEYVASFASGGRGSFTRDKPDYEGSPIPLRLDYAFAGDALVVTVDDGAFIGQYRMVRKQK